MAIWLLLETTLPFRAVSTTREAVEQVVAVVVSIRLAVYVLGRRPPVAARGDGLAWALVLLSVALPLAFAAVCPAGPELAAAAVVRWLGIAMFAWSVSALGTSFSVLPQARDLVASGPYRIVRHPMYAAYIVMDAAWWINHFTWPPFAVWACEVIILGRRAAVEEQCLRVLGDYDSYATRVEYRLCPGVY